MKILHYSNNFGTKTETFIYNEIDQLSQSHEVAVVSTMHDNPEKFPYPTVNIVKHYEHILLGRILGLLGLSNFKKQFKSAIIHFQPDVLHLHFGTIATRVLEHYFPRDIPIVISFHGYDASAELNNKKYLKRLANVTKQANVSAVFASNFMKENLAKAGIRFKQDTVIYYGTDVSTFERHAYPPKSPFIFLQTSSFHEKKGHQYTLKAYQLFLENNPNERENTRLVLAGGGLLFEEMKKFAQELGIAKNVKFEGWVDIAKNHELLHQAHAFLHHSITGKQGDMEGIPNAIMEGMAMELPIISTYHSGIPELVIDEKNGYLVKEKDVTHYAQRMKDILGWGYLPENRARIIAIFEKKLHAQKLTEFYQRISKA